MNHFANHQRSKKQNDPPLTQANPSAIPHVQQLASVLGNQALQNVLAANPKDTTETERGPSLLSWAVTRPEWSPLIQAKLAVNQPGDLYEQEANRVANEVMRATESDTPARTELSTTPVSTANTRTLPERVDQLLKSSTTGGRPLPESERQFFEPRFQRSFEDVRIHTDATASLAAQTIHARAFALGNHIVFGPGQYRPESAAGRRLLAHELTHCLQQGTGIHSLIHRWIAPTDWLDYIGLAVDAGERLYIELAYEEGEEKDFQRFVNTLFFAIDLILAAAPGAGGGGLAVRASHGAAVATWGLIPDGTKVRIIDEVAKQMGWTTAKTAQMINAYFRESSGSGGGSTGGGGHRGPSGRRSTERYLRRRWDKATFETVEKSIEYHVSKHGKGLSKVEYTQRAEKAFRDPRAIGQSTSDKLGRAAVKIVSEEFGTGLFTPHGKIIWFHPTL